MNQTIQSSPLSKFQLGDNVSFLTLNEAYPRLIDCIIVCKDYQNKEYILNSVNPTNRPGLGGPYFKITEDRLFYTQLLPNLPMQQLELFSADHKEVSCPVTHCQTCGKEKKWYQPFRGERELICPACPNT